jgi:hypothetical protein
MFLQDLLVALAEALVELHQEADCLEYLAEAEVEVQVLLHSAHKLKILFHDNYFVGDVSWQAD